MNEIPTAGWVAIILIGGLLLVTNLSLIAALRNRGKKQNPPQFQETWKTMNNPWGAEDRQWNELSKRVKQLNPDKQDDDED